jgi:hypothetical protein
MTLQAAGVEFFVLWYQVGGYGDALNEIKMYYMGLRIWMRLKII